MSVSPLYFPQSGRITCDPFGKTVSDGVLFYKKARNINFYSLLLLAGIGVQFLIVLFH